MDDPLYLLMQEQITLIALLVVPVGVVVGAGVPVVLAGVALPVVLAGVALLVVVAGAGFLEVAG